MTFLKTNIITLISKVICLAFTLFISIYIARFLGPESKGMYYLLVQIVSILATISLFGVDSSAIYHMGKGYSARHIVFLSAVFTMILSIAMAMALILISNPGFLSNILSGGNYAYIVIIASVMPFMALSRLNSAVVMGLNRFLAFNVLNIILFGLMVINFIIFVVFLKMGLIGALISFALAYFIISFVYIAVILNSKPMKKTTDKKIQLKKLLDYGGRIFMVPILLLLIYRVDSFFLGYYINVKAVGFYSVALSFAELLLFIPESTGTILFPKLAHTKPEEINHRFISIFRISVIITTMAAAFFFLTIKYLLPLVYGASYSVSVGLTYILLPGLFAMSAYYLFSSYFQATGRPGFVAIILTLILLEKAALCFFLIPRMGPKGAALAATISYLTCFLIFLFEFRRKSEFKFKEILVLKQNDINFVRSFLNNIFDFQK